MKVKCFIIIFSILIKGNDYFLGGLQLLNFTVKQITKAVVVLGPLPGERGMVFTGGI